MGRSWGVESQEGRADKQKYAREGHIGTSRGRSDLVKATINTASPVDPAAVDLAGLECCPRLQSGGDAVEFEGCSEVLCS